MTPTRNRVTVAPSDGWELIYCKGPEGEQLEFVQALGPVKATIQRSPDETTTDDTVILRTPMTASGS